MVDFLLEGVWAALKKSSIQFVLKQKFTVSWNLSWHLPNYSFAVMRV